MNSIHAQALKVVKQRLRSGGNLHREPVRDWSFGFITGHRLRVTTYLLGMMAVLYVVQDFFWPYGKKPESTLDLTWSWLSLLWITAVIPGTLGLMGMLAFRFPNDLDKVQPINRLVCWRIVSRGDNFEALTSTVRRCQDEMAKTPLFPYIIEVVTDTVSFALPAPNDDVRCISVPQDYITPMHSRFKARALHYACLNSSIPEEAWIVHLDEETQPTSSGIKGIAKMIREEEISRRLRIGQGGILYHRKWEEYPFLTLADNVRTGDDFARFHFQHQLGITVFGLHGSYIVVRNDVEKATGGFDFGPQGDITEDAFWAMVVMEQGKRCRWVEGYLEEQSTQSLFDFLKQRRRWFQGLAKVALYAPVKIRWRVCIGINTALWCMAPFAMVYTYAHFFYGFEIRPWVRFLANYSYASFAVLYLIGLKANLDEHGVTNRWKRAMWSVLQVVLLPAFSMMESCGILWAILQQSKGFDVIKK